MLVAEDPDVIVGMERGGAFVADAISEQNPDLASKIRKIPVYKASRESKKKYDSEAMQNQFEKFIADGAHRIALVDVYMGGRTAAALRDEVFTKIMARNSGVTFRLHWIRETMGFENRQGEGSIPRLQGEIRKTSSPYYGRLTSMHHHVRMAIGDDMEVAFDSDSRTPITVFDRDGKIVRKWFPDPGQTTRDLLIKLLSGSS